MCFNLKWIGLFVALWLLFGLSFGCAGKAATVQERTEELQAQIDAFRALKLDGRVVVIWGSGHVAGQAFNLTGSSGFAEVILKPEPEPD